MTKKCKFKKDIRQPSIVNVLKGNSAEALEYNTESEVVNHENNTIGSKCRRDTSDSNESNTPNSNLVKKDKRIPRMASEGNIGDIALDATPLIPHTEESTQILSINETSSPQELEHNKKTSTTIETTIHLPPKTENPTDMDKMELRLTRNMQAMLKPIQKTLAKMTKVKDKVEQHEGKIKRLEMDNWRLNAEVKMLKQELKDVNKRITE